MTSHNGNVYRNDVKLGQFFVDDYGKVQIDLDDGTVIGNLRWESCLQSPLPDEGKVILTEDTWFELVEIKD